MNSLTRPAKQIVPIRSSLIQPKRNRLIIGDGYKDGFKEIPDHGYAPKHAKAYADLTTPPPKYHREGSKNIVLFRWAGLLVAFMTTIGLETKPNNWQLEFYKNNRPLADADERYVKYLTQYYTDEINKIIDDEAVIAASGVRKMQKQ